MPEGDTVWRTANRLNEALAGRPLLAADLRWPGISTADLRGVTVLEVTPRGKHLLARLGSGWTLHSHLRMEGQWRIDPTTRWASLVRQAPAGTTGLDQRGSTLGQRDAVPDERDGMRDQGDGLRGQRDGARGQRDGLHPQRSLARAQPDRRDDIRAILVGPEWTAVGLRLGMLDLVRTSEEHTLVGHLGPDILASDFAPDLAVANLAASAMSIGAALLDQRNLAGIGTLWSSESLFLERLRPWQPADDLPAATLTRLVERAQRLMSVNCGYAVQSSTGDRRAGHTSYVHARSGRPCRRCGGTVRVASIGPPTRERPMFYCPGCQGGLAPTDEGRSIAPLGARRRRPPSLRLS